MKKFQKNGAEVVGISCIACLAHLAILYEVVCRTGSITGDMYSLCDSALERLGVVTSEFHIEEYTYLDLLLGVRPSLRSSYSPVMVAHIGDRDRIHGTNR